MKINHLSFRCAVGVALSLMCFQTSTAALAEPVKSFSVDGATRFDADTAVNYLTFRKGDNPSRQDIDDSVKALLRSGVFSNAEITSDGSGAYTLRVKENPVVAKLYFEGNDRFDEKALKDEILIEEGGIVSESKIKSSLVRLQDLYKKSGRYAAKIEPFVINRDDNRVDFVFKIDEGEIVYIEDITFVGNRRFTDSRLRGLLESQEDAWWRFFTANTSFDEDRLAVDKTKLSDFYRKNGFVDFTVESAVAELNTDRDSFVLKFIINEGKRYEVNSVKVEDAVTNVPVDEIEDLIDLDNGDYYDANKATKAEDAIVLLLSSRGYPFVKAESVINRLPGEESKLDLVFKVTESDPAYVGRIEVNGNSRTVEDVIRRKMYIAEGDPLNRSLLERSKRELRGTGYFKTLEIEEKETDVPGTIDLVTQVEEQSTGDVTFGVGYSTTDSALGEVSLSERNFLGLGQYVRVGALFSGRRQEFDFGFTEPYFLGRDLSAGFDLYHTTTNFRNEASYDERNTGAVLRSGFNVGEDLTLQPRYRINQGSIQNLRDDVSAIVRDTADRGSLISSSLGYELRYDRRDDFIEPTSGYALSLTQDAAGVGGDVKLLKSVATGTLFYTPIEDFTFSWQLEGGSALSYGGYDARIIDRFFMGGNSFRGFEIAGLGPRFIPNNPAKFNDDPVGGDYYGILRSEVSVPLPGLSDLGMQGVVFNDTGSLFGLDNAPDVSADGRIRDETSLRSSVGVGVKWRSPVGPIRLDFARPVLKERYDRTEVFRFSAGSSF